MLSERCGQRLSRCSPCSPVRGSASVLSTSSSPCLWACRPV